MYCIKDIAISSKKILDSKGIHNSYNDTRLIIQYVMKYQSQLEFYKNLEYTPNAKEITTIEKLIKRRSLFEPIAYIIGEKEFYSYTFYTDSSVLIPRSDSEIIVDAVIKYCISKNNKISILDLGIGSGCLLLTLLKKIPNAIGTGIDLASIKTAKKNRNKLELENRADLIRKSWEEYDKYDHHDIIVSNPPYIEKDEIDLMSTETILYEPSLALYTDKCNSYRNIYRSIKNHFKGTIFLEVSPMNHIVVKDIFEKEKKFKLTNTFLDLSSQVRCLSFKS